MNLDRLKTLLAFAKGGSVAAAARALEIGQNTVQKRISELEDEVGVALVTRAGRRLVLTSAGQELVRGGRELVVRGESLIDQVRTNATGVVGEYRVAIPVGLPPQVNAMVLAGHRACFSGIRHRVLPVARPMTLLPDEADIAVTFESRPGEGPWLSAVIRRVPELVLASRQYVDRHGAPASVQELTRHQLLSWIPPGEDPTHWPLREGGSMTVRTWLSSPDILLVRQCLAMGMGLARVPDAGMSGPVLPDGGVVPILPEVFGRELELRVVMPDTPKMRAPYRQYLRSIRALEETF
ncbi:LysR family transcriptional regulator [Haliangium sp.]|uniref:LysR family transcriptional regulator n=1 Tax=Haliangium sp. TaxID=2663208 RepID=UPI003D09737B